MANDTPGTTAQPKPLPIEGANITDLVVCDLRQRHTVGLERYGQPLRAFNGRDALVDAYQEALDLCMYLRQEIEERREAERAVQPRVSDI